jgi:hypothetical protein
VSVFLYGLREEKSIPEIDLETKYEIDLAMFHKM